ncbi:integrase [Streptosporangium sp. NPDC002544]|uniref:integrase n=1 Tax=Streptosporangium sp. NPDC002544 TaxID=3154538 RepID=UPI0033298B52
MNAFFSSAKIRNRADATAKKYITALGVWLTFLDRIGRPWWEAIEDDVEEFVFWRLTDPANERRVTGGTVHGNLIAMHVFYAWAEPRYGVDNPVSTELVRGRKFDHEVRRIQAGPHIIRDKDVKWLDPSGYQRWRDMGLRGFDIDGLEDPKWRGRNTQRDSAFADGLYGTGLRLSEWASVLDVELPTDDADRSYSTCYLASKCAKGNRGRLYWMPRTVLVDVLSYMEGARAAAIRRARRSGRYERLTGVRVLEGVTHAGELELVDASSGEHHLIRLDELDPRARLRLFRRTPGGLEPLAVWLNEDGLARPADAWEKTFERANDRLGRAGLEGLVATPHMLRHSFALRWYSAGRLSYELRYAHLGDEELRDFREQFGDVWHLVQTMLGHVDVTTTKNTYLEPFRALDVILLLEHTRGSAVADLLGEMFVHHPYVRTDPRRGEG